MLVRFGMGVSFRSVGFVVSEASVLTSELVCSLCSQRVWIFHVAVLGKAQLSLGSDSA